MDRPSASGWHNSQAWRRQSVASQRPQSRRAMALRMSCEDAPTASQPSICGLFAWAILLFFPFRDVA
jgi:hypothetical protein